MYPSFRKRLPYRPSGLDAFARLQTAANATEPHPTPAQKLSGDYSKGKLRLHGLAIDIESVRNSVREGTSPNGTRWANRMAAHYGEFPGTLGADGDPVDVFVGLFPESLLAWVINQRHVGGPAQGFDECKVMLGFTSEQQARDAYTDSFDRGWQGLASIYPISLTGLKWWLCNGDMSHPFSPDQLPFVQGNRIMDKVLWDANAQPVTTPLHKLMYDLRVHDKDDGLMLDAVTMDELMGHPDIDETPLLDALVVQVARMQQKMDLLKGVMQSAGEAVKPVEMTISDPVRARGVLQVMVLFLMSDGQTVSIWLHNPDTTPAKLTPMDDLISWKWMLNKKDVTIVVAPERGKDLNVREVARRVMRLIERNSEAFKKANTKTAERAAQTEAVKTEITGLESELAGLNHKIEVAQQVKIDTPAPVVGDALLHKFVGQDDMQSEVRSRPDGKFGAILRDLDSGAVAGVYIVDTEEAAIVKAKELVRLVPVADQSSPGSKKIGDARDAFADKKLTEKPGQAEIRRMYNELAEKKEAGEDISGTAQIFRDGALALKNGGQITDAEYQQFIGLVGDLLAAAVDMTVVQRQMDDEMTYARQGTFSPGHISSNREAALSDYFTSHAEAQAAHETAVQQAWGERQQGETVDPNIGREWNSTYGRQKIESRNDNGIPSYGVRTVGTDSIRNYSVSSIEAVIKSDEHRLTPEYEKEKAEQAEIRLLQEQNKARANERAEKINAEIKAFTDSQGMSAPNAERARLALIELVRHDGNVMSRKTMIDDLVAAGYVIGHAEGKRALENGTGSYMMEKNTTKTGMDYAVYLIGKKGESDSNSPSAIVDAAYQFASASDAFKAYVADSVEETDYSPFASAKAMDEKAIELGATVAWDVSRAVLDGVEGEAADGDQDDGGDDFDADEEFEAAPELDDDGKEKEAVLDGDFKGHPYRGNQYKAASHESGSAVHASQRAKGAESKGDKKGAKIAHKSAHYSHKAAAVLSTGKAKKYHKTMAKFHGGRAGMVLDSVLDAAGTAKQDVTEYARRHGLKVANKGGVVSVSNPKNDWMELFDDWAEAFEFLKKQDHAHRDTGTKFVFDAVRDADGVLDDAANWHSKTMDAMKSKNDAALRYIIKDATEAAEAGEKMDPPNPKAGQYRDEAHYASMEIQRRKKGGKQILDAADDMAGEYVTGVISMGGAVAGRAFIGGDGKAMVYTGAAGLERVQFFSTFEGKRRNAVWSEDGAAALVGYLFAAAVDPAPEPQPAPVAADNDARRLNVADRAAPKGAITSDDPQAIEKLQAKLTALLLRQEFMKKANKLMKKGDNAALLEMGLTQFQIDEFKKPDFAGRTGFADYLLTNNNGVISSTRKRMDAMIADRMRAQALTVAEPEAQEPAALGKNQFYNRGSLAEYTGETELVAGALFYQAKYLEGASMGQTFVTARAPDGSNPLQQGPTAGTGIVTPQIPALHANPQIATDRIYLQSLIDGTADMFAADIFERLEPMFATYQSDAAMMTLLNQAAEAYSQAAVKAAQAALAA